MGGKGLYQTRGVSAVERDAVPTPLCPIIIASSPIHRRGLRDSEPPPQEPIRRLRRPDSEGDNIDSEVPELREVGRELPKARAEAKVQAKSGDGVKGRD